MFQFYNLIPSLTVFENVALVNEIAEKPLDPREVLKLVGLEERLDHFPSQLSGGRRADVEKTAISTGKAAPTENVAAEVGAA